MGSAGDPGRRGGGKLLYYHLVPGSGDVEAAAIGPVGKCAEDARLANLEGVCSLDLGCLLLLPDTASNAPDDSLDDEEKRHRADLKC